MRRREFITLVGGAAAWPLRANAQQPVIPTIGFLSNSSPELYAKRLSAFREGLSESGYVEGQNVGIEYRWAEGQNDRLPELAADLVRRQVTVIASGGGTSAAVAAKGATSTIPVVFGVGVDPVKLGLVASLNRPGGNMTGITNLNVEVGPKRLQLLHELLPASTTISLLVNPTVPAVTEQFTRALTSAANKLGLQINVLEASNEQDFDKVFATLIQLPATALVIMSDVYFTARSAELGALSLHYGVPAVYQFHEFTAAGGLVSYGTDNAEFYRLIGNYAARVLKGEKPSDLPVVQAAKFELILNLKTAKALGINVPIPILGRADEVIE
jgi:putative tryptophan/tyrosine transport system substrate-binding protein